MLYPGYVNVTTPVLYYNKSHWAKAGLDPEAPPGTLDEVYEQAKVLKEPACPEKPFVLKTGRWFFETWLSGVGADVVNNDNGRGGPATEATFDSPEAVELLEFLQKMNDEGLLNVFASTEGGIDHYLALVTQQSSMLIETSTASTTIRDALARHGVGRETGVDFDQSGIDISELAPGTGAYPGIEAPGKVFPSGGAFYILNTSEPGEQAASWRFLEFMLQPENAKEWHLKGGYLPIVKAVLDDPDVQTFWAEDVAGVLLQARRRAARRRRPRSARSADRPLPDFTDAVEARDGVGAARRRRPRRRPPHAKTPSTSPWSATPGREGERRARVADRDASGQA